MLAATPNASVQYAGTVLAAIGMLSLTLSYATSLANSSFLL
jgi:hypothetical protein